MCYRLNFVFLFWFQQKKFWFATGGAGFCLSRALVNKMRPYIRYCYNHLRSVHSMMLFDWVRHKGTNLLTWQATSKTGWNYLSCILFPYFNYFFEFGLPIFSFVILSRKLLFFLSMSHLSVFLATKAFFLAGYRYKEWLVFNWAWGKFVGACTDKRLKDTWIKGFFHFVYRILTSFCSDGKFIESCERIKLPDDCTVGFISGKFIDAVTFDSPASFLQTLTKKPMISDYIEFSSSLLAPFLHLSIIYHLFLCK